MSNQITFEQINNLSIDELIKHKSNVEFQISQALVVHDCYVGGSQDHSLSAMLIKSYETYLREIEKTITSKTELEVR